MLSEKYETASAIAIEAAQYLYEDFGIITVVTDGKFVQIGKEELEGM